MNSKYGRFTTGFMKSFNFAKKLVSNPGFFFNFNKNDAPLDNIDERVRK